MTDGKCEVRLTRRYAATPAEVWAALTDPSSIGRWLAPAIAIELAPGGPFELAMPGSDRIEARVREVEREHVLELDWVYAAEDPSIVRFELTADGDGTVLVLDHRRIDERFGMTYITRWTAAMGRLGGQVRAR